MRLQTAGEAIPIVGFMASQAGEVAGPAGILLLGVYTSVYVAKAVTEMRKNNGNGKPLNGAVMAASIAHIEKTTNDMATDLRTIHARLDAHGDRLTRSEASCSSQARDLQRIREEGCQQLQRHLNVLRDIDAKD
jgi:hypothetical protein